MNQNKNKILVDKIKRLLRRNDSKHLTKIVNKTHAADLSELFRSLSLTEQLKLFEMIKNIEHKGVLFAEIEDKTFLNITENMEIDVLVDIFENMPSDDIADLLAKLPSEKSDAILEKMKKEGSEEVEGLLSYDDETAGGIMTPDFISFRENISAKTAIEKLQSDHRDVEMPFYLYVVNEYDKLVGVSSLRQLVVVPPETPLKKFMATDIFSVQTDVDQEEVAKIVDRYDILAVPVVDNSNKMVGIVTVDDVIDIFRKEATEDILRMAGAGEEFVETQTVYRSTKRRLPWLFASCIGGIIAFFVIGKFEKILVNFTYLAAFMPVILGMGGNIGTQSSTIVVRGLATGRLQVSDLWSVVFKELSIGLILGIIYGLFIGIVAQVKFFNEPFSIAFAISVGVAVLSSMTVAALVGSLVPMLFEKIHIDPAIATGPFVTTSIDILSVFFYFSIATAILRIS